MSSLSPVEEAVIANTTMQSATHRPLHSATEARKQHKTHTGPLTSLFAGAIAGGVEATATYPFEFAKTRTQLLIKEAPSNPIRLLAKTVASEGESAIYTGCGTLIAGTALKAGVRFLAFDSIKTLLVDENGRLSALRGVLAGMAAGATESAFAVTPTERVKTALIDDARGARRFRNGPHAVAVLVKEQGITALYRGLVSTTLKQSATSGVRMGSYNWLKRDYTARVGRAPNSSLETFSLGALAGVVTVYATQPFDTIKTQAQSSQGRTFVAAIQSTLRSGGVRAFWAGSTMRLGRLVFSGGIVFSIYEKVVAILG